MKKFHDGDVLEKNILKDSLRGYKKCLTWDCCKVCDGWRKHLTFKAKYRKIRSR